jgi:6-phosphofructokinase 1
MQRSNFDFRIKKLGERRIPSPIRGTTRFTEDDERVLYDSRLADIHGYIEGGTAIPAMEAAGPRQTLFFDPAGLKCGIVTCGGICPGLNDVIRAIVLSLYHHYGVRSVYGFRFGYEGLVPRYGHKPFDLTPEAVARIYEVGGTILGSSRGPQDTAEMVDYLEDLGIGILFAIDGDGTLRGAQKIADEAAARSIFASSRRSPLPSTGSSGP